MIGWLTRLVRPAPPAVVVRAQRVATDLETLADRRRREADDTVSHERDREAALGASGAFILDALRSGSLRTAADLGDQ